MSSPAPTEPNAPAQGTDASSTGSSGATTTGETRANPTPTSGAGAAEQVTRGPDYFREAFSRIRGHTQVAAPAPNADAQNGNAQEMAPQAPPASQPTVTESERSAERSPSEPSSGQGAPGSSTTLPPSQGRGRQETPATGTQGGQIVLTQAELQRRIQAEADRILAKQRKDAEAQSAIEQERELRRTNPFEYARLMESKEQELEASRAETQRLTEIVGTQLQFYDRAVLDQLVGALPEAERPKVIAPDGDGIENRKKTAANALKALRSRYVAEGRASAKADLMKDQTFIKEVLARYGQTPLESTPAYTPSPAAARPSNGVPSGDENSMMGNWMREAARGVRSGKA